MKNTDSIYPGQTSAKLAILAYVTG